MPTLAKGYLRAYPMRVSTTATLQSIADALNGHGPDRQKLQNISWGSIHDDVAFIGTYAGVPTAETIHVHDPEERQLPGGQLPPHDGPASVAEIPIFNSVVPAQILQSISARCYWFVKNTPAQRALPQGSPAPWRLQAADVILMAMSGTTDLLLLVTSWNDDDLSKRVLPALQNMIRAVDEAVTISMSTSDLVLPSADLYLWLVNRMMEGAPVSSHTALESLDKIEVRDPLGATSVLADGITSNRLDLKANLADDGKSYGPAYLSVHSTLLEASYAFHLHLNGQFQIDLNASEYYDGESRTAVDERLRQVVDMASIIIPELIAAYAADKTWEARREVFRQATTVEAINQLQQLNASHPAAP